MPQGLTLRDWITAAVILVVGVAASRGVRYLTQRFIQGDDVSGHDAARFVARIAGFVVVAGAIVYALSVLEVQLGPLLGAVGIGGLAIAFAAQSILENTFASILLQVRHPFRHGDQIKTGDYEGTVVDVNFRTVVLRTIAGERVLVPCAMVLRNPIVNHTAHGRRSTTLTVRVSPDVDLAGALRQLEDAAASADGVHESPKPSALVKQFGDYTVDVAVTFWHRPDQAGMARTRSNVAVAIAATGIEMPSPQAEVRLVGSLPADGGGGGDRGRGARRPADGAEPAVERVRGRRNARR